MAIKMNGDPLPVTKCIKNGRVAAMWKIDRQILGTITILVLISIIMSGCHNSKPKEQDLLRLKSASGAQPKKVIYVLVDSLMPQAIDRGIRAKELPTLQFLTEHGQYYKNLVSSFPTMSVSIDSTLLTGKYPIDHRVPGLTWYSAKDKKVINYGTGPVEIVQQGVNRVLNDAIIHLNQDHLNNGVTTIHEDLTKRGLKSGSVNGLVYRGARDHTLSLPGWIHIPSTLPKEIHVNGPDFLTLGSLSNPLKGLISLPESLTDKLGFNNDYAIEVVKYLVQSRKLPDFLFVYLPDLDQELHKNGPSASKGLKALDRQLDSLLQSFGSREQALKEAVIIVAGDSGMTAIRPSDQNPEIDLPDLIGDARVLSPGETGSKEKDILFAVNETMAYVYSLKGKASLNNAAALLQADSRIDFVAWRDRDRIHVSQGGTTKQLSYKAGGTLKDPYKQSWTLEGDAELLDLRVNQEDQTLDYVDYPDALMRLSSALHSHEGDYLVVTAKPGYELTDKSSPKHEGGGGHGSIRKAESLVPLIIGGTAQRPQSLRVVDLKYYLLDLLSNDLQNNGMK